MAITRLQVRNFKSFRELNAELGPLTIVVGANASGKSNFVNIFRFLRDIVTQGLENAVSLQGGASYLSNIRLPAGTPVELTLTLNGRPKLLRSMLRSEQGARRFVIDETKLDFALEFKRQSGRCRITRDTCVFKGKIAAQEGLGTARPERRTARSRARPAKVTIANHDGRVDVSWEGPEEEELPPHIFDPRAFGLRRIDSGVLLVELPFSGVMFAAHDELRRIAIHDFDPRLAKKATPIEAKAELDEHGGNLAVALTNVLRHKHRRDRFLRLLGDVLDFVKRIDVQTFADRSLLLRLGESFYKRRYLPASLISDGTIHLLALILALYFERSSLTIIEEPERNVHPSLIAKIVEMLKDASREKQIIVTTHSPELLKHADLESILFISRGEDGFSTAWRPAEKKEVAQFLTGDLGVEDLFVQNILDALR